MSKTEREIQSLEQALAIQRVLGLVAVATTTTAVLMAIARLVTL